MDSTLPGLIREHGPALHRYASGLLRGSPVEPDDVLQEVWLRAHHLLAGEREHPNVAAWLRVVTRNCALDARRGTAVTTAVPDELAAPGTVVETVERRHAVREVLGDLAALEPRQRVALLRHAVDGVAHEQLAGELGSTPAASKSLVLRARRSLARRASARARACTDIRSAITAAHARGVRTSEEVRLHVEQCRGCRQYRRRLRGGFWAAFPLPGFKLAAAIAATATVSAAAWSVTRHEVVEPWKGPSSPSWTLGPGTAFSSHRVTADGARSIDLPLRCPRGYGLFQFDFGRHKPPITVHHGPWLTWLGAPSKTLRLTPEPGQSFPASFALEVTCLKPERLLALTDDAAAQAAIRRNLG